ncbi:MAG: hypothetical protein JO104_05830 [Candidatus Eremiobacteraeota bacterium]|nr:hypothetical protein [Candidatus Eremiobacteraeota bacterium]
MYRVVFAVAMLLAVVGVTPTPPPQIYHIVTRPLCSELHEHIAPAIGMMLQNDSTIKKSPELFKQYNAAALYGSDASTATGNDPLTSDPGGISNPSQNMALQGMENLIRPIANNVIAIQTMLDSPQLTQGTGREDDDKQLQAIREKLLKALAAQNASLDIISGFVDTQQMADLQHAGEAYIASVSKPDTSAASTPAPAINPLERNPNYAGLPPNPYSIELATIPGLTLGYNPVTRLLDALRWTIDQTATRENDAAKAVMSSAALCSSSVPVPSPTP